jgi:hypothetical protein
MMLPLRNVTVGLAASVLFAGCTTTTKADAPPGATVTTENESASWLPRGISGEKQGMQNWTRIRVIAPAGARQCVSGSVLPLIYGGPQAIGRPDTKGEVMLTTDMEAGAVHIRCTTADGDVARTVKAYRYSRTFQNGMKSSFPIQPPMIHMNPSDPQAEARWTELRAEICKEGEIGPRSGFLCEPEIFAALKAADLGAG